MHETEGAPLRVAVVTGGNRGIGLETCRQLAALGYTVVLTARDVEAAREAAASLGGDVHPEVLDVTSTDQAQALSERLQARYGQVDALVNNAGAILPGDRGPGYAADPAVILGTIDVNALGALRVTQALLPLLRAAKGAVVNVSSGMGGITEMNGGNAGYRLSKASLNALTRILHDELNGAGLRINAVCPGWVQTRMGGARATRSVEDGARGVVWAATLPPDGPSGGFFRDGRPIAF